MSNSKNSSLHIEYRDIFLSHRSVDSGFTWKLAGDIEKNSFRERQLLTWVDEAEIRSGHSVVGMINQGLEMSRFIGIVMTPDYFMSESGWTDAEWHAAISTDPDNRKGRVIPLLVKDCSYVPFLLSHLKAIDMRGNRYEKGLSELLVILREQPLPRPSMYRGQLITPSGMITRETLYAERSVPEGDPDVTSETLHCNLIPIERLPQTIYTAPIAEYLYKSRSDGSKRQPSKQEIKHEIRDTQEKTQVVNPFVPVFRLHQNKIVTFNDLDDPEGPLNTVVDNQNIEQQPTLDWIRDEDERRILISLLNMGVTRRLLSIGLVHDEEKQGRFFFPPKDGGVNLVEWRPFRKRIKREVAGPRRNREGNVTFWRHLAAYIKIIFLANNFFLQIKPTWVFTDDGFKVKRGPNLTRLVNKWTNPERNISVMYHVWFWTSVLRKTSGPILIRVGDQFMELSNRPAFIELHFGISDDQKDLMHYLDDEVAIIKREEDELIELAAEEVELKKELPPDESEEEEDGEMLMDKEDLGE
jgi:hypothetical protein